MRGSQEPKRRRHEGGFTLVELMVVVAIIAILATIVGVNVLGEMEDASIAQAKGQIRNLKTALMSYRIKFNRFPSASEGLNALVDNEKGRAFLDPPEVPKDPWGNEYLYTSEDGRYLITCHGADGSPGGTGVNADIDSDHMSGED